MKKLLIISILALSSLSFGATALEQSLMNLDQQLQKLDQMEQQKFNQQKALADAAQGRLDKYREMDATIDSFPIYKGQIAVEMALRKLGGQALPKVIWTPQALIDITNVNEPAEKIINWQEPQF